MGGDYAPENIIAGALEAARNFNIRPYLVGVSDEIERVLRRHPTRGLDIEIIHAEDVVSMDDHALVALRRKKKSSIRIAADLLKQGDVHGVLSAGHTGAAMATVKVVVGSHDGVERPGLATVLPTLKGLLVIIDVGANIDCKPLHIQQFGIMGHIFAREVLGIEHPRAGLLSIGEEASKGNEQTREAFALLQETPINFSGNLDAKDVYDGDVDVVVCDGFLGNVALKISESLADSLLVIIKEHLSDTFLSRVGMLLSRAAYKKIKKKIDWSEYGGAFLLGIRGICVICHGRSSPNAVKNAIRMAVEFRQHNVNELIQEEILSIQKLKKKNGVGV
jgi:glycerol-3-phosphate acyltransferase PlsX